MNLENNMTGLTDLVGVLFNCGMISSGDTRLVNAVGSTGVKKSNEILLNTFGVSRRYHTKMKENVKAGSNLFGLLIKVVTGGLKVERQSSSKGLLMPVRFRGLTSVLFDSQSGTQIKEPSIGGEAMAILVILAYQAFKNIDRQPAGMLSAIVSSEILLGLRIPVNIEEENELEQTATLILKGMINAAKAGSQIGHEETHTMISLIRESNCCNDTQKLIFEEMQLPLNLDRLVNEIPNESVAALVYAASLFAIEVDTPAELEYLEQFVQRTGLDARVAQQLLSAVGVK